MSKEIIKNIFGYSASICLIVTPLSQIYYTYKTKQANDISYIFVSLQTLTCALFLVYGILLGELPIILSNTFVLLTSIVMFILKYIYTKNS